MTQDEVRQAAGRAGMEAGMDELGAMVTMDEHGISVFAQAIEAAIYVALTEFQKHVGTREDGLREAAGIADEFYPLVQGSAGPLMDHGWNTAAKAIATAIRSRLTQPAPEVGPLQTESPVKNGFWIVLRDDDERLHRHSTMEAAAEEAVRLARKEIGHSFFTLGCEERIRINCDSAPVPSDAAAEVKRLRAATHAPDRKTRQFLETCAGPAFTRNDLREEAKLILSAAPTLPPAEEQECG